MREWRNITFSLRRGGSAMVATVVALSILLWLGAMLARLMQTETDSAVSFRDGIAAQYLAEAGVRRALVVLYNGGEPAGLTENIRRNKLTGSYRITTFSEAKDSQQVKLRVRSSAQVGSARRSASALVEISLKPSPEMPLKKLSLLSWGI